MRCPGWSGLLPVALGAGMLSCGETEASKAGGDGAPSPHVTAVDSLSTVADSLYRAGNFSGAKDFWIAALREAQSARDIDAEARILTSLGLSEWRLGDHETATGLVQQARGLLESNDLRAHLPRTLNALGLIAWDRGRLSEAAGHWQRTIQIAREIGDEEYVAKPSMNLGLWYAGIGELEQARQAFDASLTAGRKLSIRALELRSLVNLAMVANRMGEPRVALAWLDSAASAGVTDDFLAEDSYRSELAFASRTLGDPGFALVALDSAVRVARAAGLRQSEAAGLALMANIFWEAGDPTRALGLHAEAEAIHRDLDLPTEQGHSLHAAARIRSAMGHTDEARALASRALNLHRRGEDLVYQLDDHLLLAELGDTAQLREARHVARQLSTRLARTRLALTEARIAANAAQPQGVLRAIGSIQHELASAFSAEVAEAEALRAGAFASLRRWDSAAASGRRGIAALERMRSSHGSGPLGGSFASRRVGIYADVVRSLVALGFIEEAFDIADAARGGLLPTVRSTRQAGNASADAVREGLLRRMGALEAEIGSREADGLDATELRDRLRRAQREYELGVLSTGGVSGRTQRNGVTASVIREALGPRDLMLAYLVAPQHLFVFVVTREGVGAHMVPVSSTDLEARVRLAREILADPRTPAEDAEPVLAGLSSWLLAPASGAWDGVQRLIIVPHGALAYLPFAALTTGGGTYVIQHYSLVHLPAASFTARATDGTATAVSDFRVTALAPLPRQLPASVLEVRAVERAHRRTRVLVGRRAAESSLRQTLRSPGITHVASHGVLNTVNPLFSRIELARGRRRTLEDDGRLEVHEVLGLEIRSRLVFLSGCETGVSRSPSQPYAAGEDYATLAAAFLGAGARQVVATLWAIPDTGAAVFAGRFYSELGRRGTAEALATAQRALLRHPRLRHPYYWASYRLSGWESIRRHPAVS